MNRQRKSMAMPAAVMLLGMAGSALAAEEGDPVTVGAIKDSPANGTSARVVRLMSGS
jgi:hypothetical protein